MPHGAGTPGWGGGEQDRRGPEPRGAGDRRRAAHRGSRRTRPASARSRRRGALPGIPRRRPGARACARPRAPGSGGDVLLRPPRPRRPGRTRLRRHLPVRSTRRAGQQCFELLPEPRWTPPRRRNGTMWSATNLKGALLRHQGRRAVPCRKPRLGRESCRRSWAQSRHRLPRVLLGQGGVDHAHARLGAGDGAGGSCQRGRPRNRAVARGRPRRARAGQGRAVGSAAPFRLSRRGCGRGHVACARCPVHHGRSPCGRRRPRDRDDRSLSAGSKAARRDRRSQRHPAAGHRVARR